MGWFSGRKARRVGFGDEFTKTHSASDHRRRSVVKAAPPNAAARSPWGTAKTQATQPALKRARPMLFFILATFPILALVVAVVSGVESYTLVTQGYLVEAEVIDRKTYTEDSGTTTYVPIFRWTDVSGEQRTASADMRTTSYDFPAGAKIGVWYDPSTRSEVRVNDYLSLWGVPTITGGAGIALFMVLILIFRRRSRPPG